MIGTNMTLRGIKKFKNKDIKAKNKQPNKKSNSSYILFEFLKIIFLRIKILSFGVYLDQKKMYLEVFIYKKNFNKINLFLQLRVKFLMQFQI